MNLDKHYDKLLKDVSKLPNRVYHPKKILLFIIYTNGECKLGELECVCDFCKILGCARTKSQVTVESFNSMLVAKAKQSLRYNFNLSGKKLDRAIEEELFEILL